MTDTLTRARELADGQKTADGNGRLWTWSIDAEAMLRTLCEDVGRLESELARLRAAPAVPAWRPIEDAPRNGTEVWAFNGEQARMRWIEGDGYALWAWAEETLSDVDPFPEQPTHFMLLPASPAAPSAQGDSNT